MLELQQQAGNQAVQELLRAGSIRAKLTISQPDDPEEKEADAVADGIMGSHADSATTVARDADEGSGRPPIENSSGAGNGSLNPISEVIRSPGEPLDSSARAFFEPRFGRDFSHVRVHTGDEASHAASHISAKAFTMGQDIVFGAGQYAPASSEGQRLVAHELVHTVQQERSTGAIQRSPAKHDSGSSIRTIGDRAVSRQAKVAKFAADAQQTLLSIDGYYDWLNGAYQRCWEHVTSVLHQADQQTADQIKVGNFLFGLGMGVFVGQFYALGVACLEAGSMMREMLDLVRPFASGATSKGISSALAPKAAAPGSPQAVSPLLMQARTFEKGRELDRNVLALAVDALQTFGPLIDTARQSENESHISEAKMTALLLADAKGAAIEAKVDETIKNLDILVQRRASAYSTADDRTIEQTIWIAHLANAGNVRLVTLTLDSPGGMPNAIANHIRDLGLIGIDWQNVRPEPKEVIVPDGERVPMEGGWYQVGHTEKVEAPGEGLLQFTLYFPGSPHDGQKVSQAAMAAQDWAQAATSAFLLEADPDYVHARP